ncbi:MAG: AtpZ/AtpI family protein [Bryobacteraceae bacterium]|jgi:F0F1-type ATP synthase assembly protein I
MADREPGGLQQLGKYLGLGFLLPCCTLVGYIIGHYLDKAFGTSWLTLVFLLLGIAAGFIELFREMNASSK